MTQLLVVRHGPALDADEFAATGQGDDKRPLSEDGERDVERVASGLRELVKRIDLVVPSPLVRAQQTAEIVAREYGITVGPAIEELRPDASFTDFVAWAAEHASRVVMIVGHAPHLDRLVAWLVSGVDREALALKKGGACLVDFEDVPECGAGVLQWMLTPAQIRRQRS